MPVEERAEIVKKLIALIKKYALEGISMLAQKDSFDPPRKDAPDPYSYCAASCAQALQMFLRMSRIDGSIAYFFEEGHKNKGNAFRHIAQTVKRETDSLTFASKEKVRLLQAADLLAWQSSKYAKDYFVPRQQGRPPKRAPRKDFQSLMEHDHSFMYLGDAASGVGIELWPMTKRSQFTTHLSMGDDGPITYWRENGEGMPIIPVEQSVGWRMGGGRMALVKFSDFRKKEFGLAFDEPRLHEAVLTLIGAMGLYSDSERVPLVPVSKIALNIEDGGGILHVMTSNGGIVAFHIPSETLEGLKQYLKEKLA